MKMTYLGLCTLLLVGCQKDENKSARTGSLPGSCSYSAAQTYTGAIPAMIAANPNLDPPGCSPITDPLCHPLGNPGEFQSQYFDVSIQANVIDRPGDHLSVILCRNADCNTTIPSISCASLPNSDTTTPCQRTTPMPNIIYGQGQVRFINAGTAGGAGFSNYSITEQLCL